MGEHRAGHAVADGEDPGHRGLEALVDAQEAALVPLDAELLEAQALRVGGAADRDQDDVGGQLARLAACGGLRGETQPTASRRATGHTPGQLEAQPLLAEDAPRELADLAVHPRQHLVLDLDDAHGGPQPRPHGAELEPDIAAADHHHAPGAGFEIGHQPVDVALVAHGMDALEVAAGAGHAPGIAAGGPDQRAIAHRIALAEGHLLSLWVDRLDRGAKLQGHPLVGPELLGADQQALEWLVAGEVFLGQGRTLIGWILVPPDHQDGSFESVLAQGNGGLSPPMPAAHDHYVSAAHVQRIAAIHRLVKVKLAGRCGPGWQSGRGSKA